MRNAIEAGWLLAAALIPVAITHEDFMLGFIQMPKVFVLRTTALYLIVMVAFEWALSRQHMTESEGALPGRLWRALMQHPARLVYFGAGAVLLANLVSIAFAPVKSIAIWGIDPGWDTYGLFNVASYLVLFGIVATHLRTSAQLRRLVWVLTGTSIVIGLYAFGQHFGFDPLKSDPAPVLRAGSTFGNPIFVGSYLLMTLPLTVALFMSYRNRMSALSHIWMGAALIALQATAIVFSLARGTWIGVAVAEIAFVILFVWVVGRRQVGLRIAIALVAGVIAVVMVTLPVVGRPSPSAAQIERLGTIVPTIGGGLSNRFTIWTTAMDVYFNVPWVDTKRFPEIPDLGFRPLRPIVGYGPDMFGYAYPLAGESTYTSEVADHGHNFIVHTALELGLLGVMAYTALIGAVGWSLYRMLRAARSGRYPTWFAYLVVGLASVFAGRIVEQITGKAQVSDLTLSWMLAAVVVAMSVMRPNEEQEALAAGPPRRGRRSVAAQLNGLRVGAATTVALAALVFWVLAVLTYVNSAIVAAEGESAAEAGQEQRAFDLLTKARDLAPSAPIHHWLLGQGLFNAGTREEDPEQKVEQFEAAYQEAQAVLARNPLNRRAWNLVGQVQRELAVVRPERTNEAIHDNLVLVQLLPGFWQVQSALAWSYVRLGLFEDGLEAIALAKELAISGDAGSQVHSAHYIEAVALQGLGRMADAIAAAQRSMAALPNVLAETLLQQLTSQSSS